MKTARFILDTPIADWSQLKHGTLREFIDDRESTAPGPFGENLEHYQAFAVELAGLLRCFLRYGESSQQFTPRSRWLMPELTKLNHRGIDKYLIRLRHWQEEVLTWEEREIFVSAVFVWK